MSAAGKVKNAPKNLYALHNCVSKLRVKSIFDFKKNVVVKQPDVASGVRPQTKLVDYKGYPYSL